MTELEYLEGVANALKEFLIRYQELANVRLSGTSCCGCSSITLEVEPVDQPRGGDEWISVDVMEL